MMRELQLLLVLRRPPYEGVQTLEALDAALVAAAFELKVSVLLIEDAVFGLLGDQHGDVIGRRTVGKLLQALPDYEISTVYACAESIAIRGMTTTKPVIPVKLLTTDEQAKLLSSQHVVWND
jgi:tRNA 2-thiouridine synthesizing protein C